MTDKLKPCPFCGGDDFFVSEWHDFVSISCRKCGTEVGPLWNTRPIEDKKDEEIKRLREALEEIKEVSSYMSASGATIYDLIGIYNICCDALEGKEE